MSGYSCTTSINTSPTDNIVNGRTDNPGVVNLHKMASALNMTLAEFLDFKELNDFSFEDSEEE